MQDGLLPLIEVREIEADNKGRKIDLRDLMDPRIAGAKVREVSVDDFIERMVQWNPQWLRDGIFNGSMLVIRSKYFRGLPLRCWILTLMMAIISLVKIKM